MFIHSYVAIRKSSTDSKEYQGKEEQLELEIYKAAKDQIEYINMISQLIRSFSRMITTFY